jgi:hypothetical protein
MDSEDEKNDLFLRHGIRSLIYSEDEKRNPSLIYCIENFIGQLAWYTCLHGWYTENQNYGKEHILLA